MNDQWDAFDRPFCHGWSHDTYLCLDFIDQLIYLPLSSFSFQVHRCDSLKPWLYTYQVPPALYRHSEITAVKLHSPGFAWPIVIESSSFSYFRNASALKICSADLKPNGNAPSTKTLFCHHTAKSGLSSGWTCTILYAALCHPWPIRYLQQGNTQPWLLHSPGYSVMNTGLDQYHSWHLHSLARIGWQSSTSYLTLFRFGSLWTCGCTMR